jgi:hypothetical protein
MSSFLTRIKNAGAMLLGRELPVQGYSGGYGTYDVGRLLGQGGSGIDWAGEAAPYYNNPIVAIGASKIGAMIGEATLTLQVKDAKTGQWVNDVSPRLQAMRVFEAPNPHQTWSQIEQAMALSWFIFGECYLFVRRNLLDQVVGFLYIPNGRISPMADKYNLDNTKLITYFEYTPPGGSTIEIQERDILYIQKGIHPSDSKRGYSAVMQSVREIVLWNDSATRQAANVRNIAQGKVLFPKPSEKGINPTPEQVGATRNLITELVRDRAGKSVMVPFEVGMSDLTQSPDKLEMDKLSQKSIDVLCAAMGGDAMAFGLPSSSKTYDNLSEALDALGKQTILPMLAAWCPVFSKVVLPDFNLNPAQYRFWYDTSDVSWLQDETDAEHERYRENFKVGGMSVESFKLKIGETPLKGDNLKNFFSIQAEASPLAVPAPAQSNSVSDWAKSLVQRDAQTRRTLGRVQLNAVKPTIQNSKQSAHDKRIEEAKRRLLDLTEKNQAGTLDSDAYQEAFSDELRSLHADMYKIGRELAGRAATAEEAELIGLQVTDLEQAFLAGLTQDLADGRYDGITPALDQRLGMYANKGSSTASAGFVDGSDDNEEFYWDMNGSVEDHCQDCPYLESNSPYMKDTLYTAPRRGDTPCLSNCKCRLVRSDGQTGFGPI